MSLHSEGKSKNGRGKKVYLLAKDIDSKRKF